MELLDLPQLAERAGIPLSLARYYRDRFIMFVPSVRVGRTVLHPIEAGEVLRLIAAQGKEGASASAIEAALEQAYPVTVITSQEVSGEGDLAGPSGIVAKLAQTLDDRGVRVEAEIAVIRQRLESLAAATETQPPLAEPEPVASATTDWSASHAQMTHLKYMLEEIQTRQASLASHEQLEWIGDVVAAAVLKPVEPGSRDAVDRKLTEIQDELHRVRPNVQAAELREAVERLTQHVQSRDESYHRALQSLVGAMRSEIAALHSSIKENRRPNGVEAIPMPLLLTGHREEANGLDLAPSDLPTVDTPGVESGKHRAPRRLGQPNRPADAPGPEQSSMTSSD